MAKRKSKKRQFTKTLSLILIVFVAIISLIFYLNPGLFNNLNDLINKGDTNSLISNINRDNYYAKENNPFLVHFIDIGQGDAIFIEFPDNKTMLIDSGDNKSENNNTLVNYILDLGVETIDYVVATHADADHIGGMDNIFYNFMVKKVFRPYVLYSGDDYEFKDDYNKGSIEYKQKSKTYGKFLNDILNETYEVNGKTQKCEWEFFNYKSDFGTNIIYNGKTTYYTVDFLSPTKSFSEILYEDANDYSPLIKISYCDFDMLFTGDAETDSELDFVTAYSENEEYAKYVDVELLKVAHHGSGTSTTELFLDLVKPEIAVISCGEDNSYYHPHQQVLDRLFENNCFTLYRTDKNGHIVLSINNLGEYEIDVINENVDDNFIAPEKPNTND